MGPTKLSAMISLLVLLSLSTVNCGNGDIIIDTTDKTIIESLFSEQFNLPTIDGKQKASLKSGLPEVKGEVLDGFISIDWVYVRFVPLAVGSQMITGACLTYAGIKPANSSGRLFRLVVGPGGTPNQPFCMEHQNSVENTLRKWLLKKELDLQKKYKSPEARSVLINNQAVGLGLREQ